MKKWEKEGVLISTDVILCVRECVCVCMRERE